MIGFLEFKDCFAGLDCFSLNQIRNIYPDIQQKNILEWCRQGMMEQLGNGWYSFPECTKYVDVVRRIANVLYAPSYVSLHHTLCFYEMIPEAVINITSVTMQKTRTFDNRFGRFVYQSVKPSFYFGYELLIGRNGKSFFMATPEKALLDLLYLYPFYKTEQDMIDLRLDEDFMEDEFNMERFDGYVERVGDAALKERAATLKKAYGL